MRAEITGKCFPTARLRMDSGEEILLQLLPDIAPQAVRSFIHLAQIGVFDGQPIGRIAPGQCIDVSYRAFHDPRAKYMIHNDALSGRYLPVAFGRVAMEMMLSPAENFSFPCKRLTVGRAISPCLERCWMDSLFCAV